MTVVSVAAVVACILGLGGLIVAIGLGTHEVWDLEPWPSPDVPARAIATVDLTSLGLHLSRTQGTRDWYGADTSFAEGAVIEYVGPGAVTVTVAALRYEDPAAATQDFEAFGSWAEDNCRWRSSFNLGTEGVVRCDADGAHRRILWSNAWMLDIAATGKDGLAPADLVDKVRDALAAQWHKWPSRQPGGSAARLTLPERALPALALSHIRSAFEKVNHADQRASRLTRVDVHGANLPGAAPGGALSAGAGLENVYCA
jgi:hypothetical protein